MLDSIKEEWNTLNDRHKYFIYGFLIGYILHLITVIVIKF